ncbi:hypothetical protein EDC04DRAFT_3139667 [Pisolithus marmoratus]|nr:hypothetical protein EDC04DRAFT_3139667 [Pisolithus marmoratus]
MGFMWSICVLIFLISSLCLTKTGAIVDSSITDALATAGRSSPTRSAHIPGSTSKPTLGKEHEDIRLLDIVLLASVDGRFHAINRTSGHKVWSMSSAGGDVPSNLAPLVRTKHVEVDPDLTDDDGAHQELYVIEPQSGDVYVMATPTSPLQPLSFSMAQLVELSPLKFAREDDERAFVGKKETSLLSIELETGRVKAISAECPWNPFEDLTSKGDIDLDELEDYIPHNEPPRFVQIFVGRTDYHVSIYTRPTSPSGRKPPVQNLSFSAYGPNNQDNDMQAKYRRTSDNTYIHSLPNGNIFSFKATESDSNDPYHLPQPQILWVLSLDSPIVAVFDVFASSHREDAFVLMQPRPPITDVLLFGDISTAQLESFYNPDTAYVGLVPGTGSLFMMSNDHYPLIGFGDTEYSPNWPLLESGPSSHFERDLPDNIDSVTKRRKLLKLCQESPFDARCLIGKRRLDLSGRSSRQLAGVPSVELPPGIDAGRNSAMGSEEARVRGADEIASLTPDSNSTQGTKGVRDGFKYSAVGSMLLAMILGAAWLLKEKLPSSRFAGFAPAPPPKGTIDADGPVSSFPSVDSLPLVSETIATHNGAAQSLATPEVPLGVTDAPALPTVATAQRRQSVHFAEPSEVQDIPDSTASLAAETGEESEKEGDAGATPKKKKAPRRRRGKRGKGNQSSVNGPADDGGAADKDEGNGSAIEENKADNYSEQATLIVPSTPNPVTPSLAVSETILGFGSHGTVVFRGSLQGRPVAVKRLLQDFVTLASREVSILQESDDHPNVIRYYYQEAQANFLYIALELCPATLADVVENPDQHRDIIVHFDPKRALRQITSGLRHLHSLKIVHRDIKPQNILVSGPKQGSASKDGGRRMLISDFGLCKKLDVDQTSFLPTAQGAQAAGTVGWRAPEILRGEVKLDDSVGDDTSQSSRGSANTVVGGSSSGKTKLTKSVDIFSLGCLFYYVLTNGSHPFGDRFEREVNIIKNVKNLDGLDHFGEEGTEAVDLIARMLDPDACNRPNTTTCLLHPFFWDPGRRLHFLQDASDRFEIMCRDPRDENLVKLETNAFDIVGQDWHSRLDKVFIENLGKFRKYDGKSVQDLLRALRNKSDVIANPGSPALQKHHYQDLPENVKRHLGPMPEGFLAYFTRRFPRLFMHVHGVISETPLCTEPMFRTYFELNE